MGLKAGHLAMVATKYGLAAVVAAGMAGWWVPEDRLSATFVALICCQATVVSGLRQGREQLLGSGLGAAAPLVIGLLPLPWEAKVGFAVAVTQGVCMVMRWPYSTVVVALFSTLYMCILSQHSLPGMALLRESSVALGIAAALAVDLLFAPFGQRPNLDIRLDRAYFLVEGALRALREAVSSGHSTAIAAQVSAFGPIFLELDQVVAEVADLQHDARFGRGPGVRRGDMQRSESTVQELALLLHHAKNVGLAASRLPGDGSVVEALDGAIAVLTALQQSTPEAQAAALDLAMARHQAESVPAPDAPVSRHLLVAAQTEMLGHLRHLVHC